MAPTSCKHFTMTEPHAPKQTRKFMVVVDDTEECTVAIRFAARRAARTGGHVLMLRVIEPEDFQHWISVQELAREEALEEAEALLRDLAADVHALAGVMPEFAIREGDTRDEVLGQLSDDPNIGVLVLGAGAGKDGPGPLVTALAGQLSGSLPVPVTVVPGNLTLDQIDSTLR